jgi:hypothetical protein
MSRKIDLLSTENLALIAATASAAYTQPLFEKIPMRTSTLSGAVYLREVLLSENPRRCFEILRMPKEAFTALCHWTRSKGLLADSTRSISVEEQIAMFLAVVTRNESNRAIQERFQHSGETVHRYFYAVLRALVRLHEEMVLLPLPTVTPWEIKRKTRFWPYFKDCIGALDGSHIRARVPESDTSRFRNRKGFLSQNVLAACTFNLRFCYVLAGWEGSAHDSRVLNHARSDSDFVIPNDKYYLADAGYGLKRGILIPYRGVRYHLQEQAQANQRPQNAQELFNLRHAMLRNAIERIFGILKRKFPLLDYGCEYPYETQVELVLAITGLFNFIRDNRTGSEVDLDLEQELTGELYSEPTPWSEQAAGVQEGTDEEMEKLREEIACAMWANYVQK